MGSTAKDRLQQAWYTPGGAPWWLLPLSFLFRGVVNLRRVLYRRGLLTVWHPGVPVIVVGNISVGGTGKTPLVVWLAQRLRAHGYRPGIVTRGYGGKAQDWPRSVTPHSDPALVGDEPVLLAQRCDCPIVAAPDRVAAVRHLLEATDCNVVISDDGLQHYRLGRDIEIIVIDGIRRFGNGACLPAGPLREPPQRLTEADFVVVNGGPPAPGEFGMQLRAGMAIPLVGGERKPLGAFSGQRVHAVAGIGNPQRFFDTLQGQGLEVIPHPFPDHHPYQARDLVFDDDFPVLMTEKDAVKLRPYAGAGQWYVPVDADMPPELEAALMQRLERISTHAATAAGN